MFKSRKVRITSAMSGRKYHTYTKFLAATRSDFRKKILYDIGNFCQSLSQNIFFCKHKGAYNPLSFIRSDLHVSFAFFDV